jgi:hypothetical protein
MIDVVSPCRVRVAIYAATIGGAPATLSSVTLSIVGPAGTTVIDPGDIVSAGSGSYYYDALINQAGDWVTQWGSAGSGQEATASLTIRAT